MPQIEVYPCKCNGNDAMTKFCEITTFHGLRDWHNADRFYLRVIWTVVLIGALSAVAFGCYSILNEYISSPLAISYLVKEADEDVHVPDVIVCPLNRFNGKYLKEKNVSDSLAWYMQLSFGLATKHPYMRKFMIENILSKTETLKVEAQQMLDRLGMSFEMFVQEASFKCSDVLIQCQGPQGIFSCCYDTSNATLMTFAGNCFRIPGVLQQLPGYGMGISVVVHLPKDNFHIAPNNFNSDGILVKLAERGTEIGHDMTFIPTGSYALLPLRATKYDFINNPPYFECKPDDPSYGRVSCFDDCIYTVAEKKCNCSHVALGSQRRYPPCDTDQFLNCLQVELIKQLKEQWEEIFNICRSRCLLQCVRTQYTAQVSYLKFPIDETRRFVESDEQWEEMKNSIVLDIYFERLGFTLIKHYPSMTEQGFLANIGGQYSLWLGGSFLTLVQLILFITRCIWDQLISKCPITNSKRLANHGATSDVHKFYHFALFKSDPKMQI
ncbi:Acid-sensing ion channel 5 [Trichinella nativa]|uniref:Acid-sensing ion channel 5 n=1 Tax=Trichinella nativa TaxID=6335 RepID=A0A0V1LFJ0_9BILA|nr:Acid-sensing ion channel 5 [Trichinella nativa]